MGKVESGTLRDVQFNSDKKRKKKEKKCLIIIPINKIWMGILSTEI